MHFIDYPPVANTESVLIFPPRQSFDIEMFGKRIFSKFRKFIDNALPQIRRQSLECF